MRTLTVGNLTKEQTDIRKSLHFTFHQLTINKTKSARPGVHNNKSHEHKYIHINHNEKIKRKKKQKGATNANAKSNLLVYRRGNRRRALIRTSFKSKKLF